MCWGNQSRFLAIPAGGDFMGRDIPKMGCELRRAPHKAGEPLAACVPALPAHCLTSPPQQVGGLGGPEPRRTPGGGE